MFRLVLILVLACAAASTARAKDFCIQLDSGNKAGSHIVLKKAKLQQGSVAPAQGYLAEWDSVHFVYYNFSPIDGSSIVGSKGLVVGLSLHEVAVQPDKYNVLNDNIPLNLGCSPGSDGKFNALDSCSAYLGDVAASAHVIDCQDVEPIP